MLTKTIKHNTKEVNNCNVVVDTIIVYKLFGVCIYKKTFIYPFTDGKTGYNVVYNF